jgi:hypothetical protein
MTINCFFSGYSYFFKFSFVENFFLNPMMFKKFTMV